MPGIGHRIKSKDNRDKRVELLSKYARRVSAVPIVCCAFVVLCCAFAHGASFCCTVDAFAGTTSTLHCCKCVELLSKCKQRVSAMLVHTAAHQVVRGR